MIERVAVIGDPHACIDELRELVSRLEWVSLDEIWTAGDLVDRGPDNHGTVQFCRERGIKSVAGNHDLSILRHYENFHARGLVPRNKEKYRTVQELTAEDIAYLVSLPTLHVIDDLSLVIVHGGLWPKLPLYAQPQNVCRAQLIKPDVFGKSVWWGEDAEEGPGGKPESDLLKEGWRRWYRLYDHEQDCVYGHSVWGQPFIHQNPGCGKTVGVDTGSCFGGSLTAGIFDRSRSPWFVSVKAQKVYAENVTRSWWEK